MPEAPPQLHLFVPIYTGQPGMNTWLLIKLAPKGVVFSFVFYPYAFVVAGFERSIEYA